ncbi:unnamed protein product, partial [marine sediment metagenome]
MDFQKLAISIYVAGLLLWFFVWKVLVGYKWLKIERLMYLPFVGGVFAFFVNTILAFYAQIPEYGVEIGIYGFVESNAKTIATFTLGIAVFVVVTFEKTVNILDRDESRQFLQLVFSSFLLSVVGVLPLYWVPQNYGWLTTLRHLKTVPYLYSLFIFAAAMVIYIY